MEFILETKNLYKTYGKQVVLNGLDINVPKGSIYGLIGKNGAGKTTLIRIICGLQKQNVGELYICGVNSTSSEINKARRKIGAIVETPSLHLNMTAHDNLKLQMILLDNYDKKAAEELLAFVGLSDTGKKEVRNFSLGMRQRLAIALALCGNPELLVLDEPINGLDPQGIIEVRELLLKINQEKKITILVSSHLLDELARIATHYGFVNNGKIETEMSAPELEASLQRHTMLMLNHSDGVMMAMTRFNNKYELKDSTTLLIYDPIIITELVLALHEKGIVVERIIEKAETLEDRFLQLIGGADHV